MIRTHLLALPVTLALAVLVGSSACSSDEASPTPTSVGATPTVSATSVPALTATGTAVPEPTPLPPPSDAFTGTGSLVTPRDLHTATLPEDGRVLVVGGSSPRDLLASAELYLPDQPVEAPPDDPQYPALFLGAFEATGSLNEARQTHASTRLADGRVLVTGGVAEGGAADTLASAEIYDPATGRFELTGEMTVPRLAHASTLLPDGRVLIVGGFGNPYIAAAEIYDPLTAEFSSTGSMQVGRQFPSLVPLSDGRVLVHGAAFLEEAPPEIYDPTTGEFTSVDAGLPADFRWPAVATGLQDSRVLLTGDCCGENEISALGTAIILNPLAGTIETVESMAEGRFAHEATLLLDGRVLITGGLEAADEASLRLASAELFDPGTGTFTAVEPMTDVRQWHTMTRLLDGRVLVIGALSGDVTRSAELFGPQGLF